tara:strand:+ start:6002 stop:7102 length:1101 start_codon:yes stop_codon:yes gene_type:complete
LSDKIKIINVVGARPNFMKIAPIHRCMLNSIKINPLLVHTGQHYDDKMSKIFFEELSLPNPDIYLKVGSGSHASQTAKIMIEFEKIILSEKPDLVLVVGDVNSTLACALVASKLNIRVAHVEAGLRSFDRQMPEEINRIITDSISDYLFVSEQSGLDNLINEGVSKDKIFYVGNVMIDSLIHHIEDSKKSNILNNIKLNTGNFALVTLHRPSNVDCKDTIKEILNCLKLIQDNIDLVFPIHPRTFKNIKNFKLDNLLDSMPNLHLLDSVGYIDFLHLMNNSSFVLTDSGGIQEETTFLGVPCITLRENTERPITIDIGTNQLVKSDSESILNSYNKIINLKKQKNNIPELWDGKASMRIVDVIESL